MKQLSKRLRRPGRIRCNQIILTLLFTLLFSTLTFAAAAKWVSSEDGWRYRKSNKSYATAEFLQIKDNWYHFDGEGLLSTGWFKVGNSSYYGAPAGKKGALGALAIGWKTIDKNTYYFKTTGEAGSVGKMLTGWQKIKKKTYYFSKKGVLKTGWQTINGKRFYFKPKGGHGTRGRMVTGWKIIKKVKYYFAKKGKPGVKGACYKSEWITLNGKQYYFNANGSVNTNTMTQSEFIKTIGKLAQKDMKKSGILASITTAQAILESGYGTTCLGMEAHNLFGMKSMLSGNTWKSAWKGKTFKKKTKEYYSGKWVTITGTFRAYDSFAESIADHSAYLAYAKNGTALRYKGVVGNRSYQKTAELIKNGGYATDPGYVAKLVRLIKQYNLTKYDKLK